MGALTALLSPLEHTAVPRLTSLNSVHDACEQPQQPSHAHSTELPLVPTTQGVPMGPRVPTVLTWQGCLTPCCAMIHMAPPALCPGPVAWVSELLGKSSWKLQLGAFRKTSLEPVFLKTQQLWFTCPKLAREGIISAFQ